MRLPLSDLILPEIWFVLPSTSFPYFVDCGKIATANVQGRNVKIFALLPGNTHGPQVQLL